MVQRRAVFLVGYMGAGKTSVGRFLARHLNWNFLDLDDKIEAKCGRSVSDVFAKDGESVFRRLEAEALAETVSALTCGEPCVVALGGGAFANNTNSALLHEFGAPVVWLDAPVDELWKRTQVAGAVRPLRTNFDEFGKRYEERVPGYSSGTFRVDTKGKSIGAVAAEVAWLMSIGCTSPQEEQ
jgi:shikimate kinase